MTSIPEKKNLQRGEENKKNKYVYLSIFQLHNLSDDLQPEHPNVYTGHDGM